MSFDNYLNNKLNEELMSFDYYKESDIDQNIIKTLKKLKLKIEEIFVDSTKHIVVRINSNVMLNEYDLKELFKIKEFLSIGFSRTHKLFEVTFTQN